MDFTFLTGLVGSLVLVLGAAWPSGKKKVKPYKSIKNWLFLIGGLIMLAYAYLGYLNDGPIFFVILEILVAIASLLMMLDTSDKIDFSVISVSSVALIIWSLFLFEGYNTIIFIVGLCGIGLGYAFEMGSLRRDVSLTLGSVLIAAFSYLEASWIFFWLNVFFAIFSGYYLAKNFNSRKKKKS